MEKSHNIGNTGLKPTNFSSFLINLQLKHLLKRQKVSTQYRNRFYPEIFQQYRYAHEL